MSKIFPLSPAGPGQATTPQIADEAAVVAAPALSPGQANDQPPAGRLYSTAQVGRLFRRSTRTIRTWVTRDYLRPVRMGRAVFFSQTELDRCLNNHPQVENPIKRQLYLELKDGL
jgi:hypothetical protein